MSNHFNTVSTIEYKPTLFVNMTLLFIIFFNFI